MPVDDELTAARKPGKEGRPLMDGPEGLGGRLDRDLGRKQADLAVMAVDAVGGRSGLTSGAAGTILTTNLEKTDRDG